MNEHSFTIEIPAADQFDRLQDLLDTNRDNARRFALRDLRSVAGEHSEDTLLRCCVVEGTICGIIAAEFTPDGTCWLHGPVVDKSANAPVDIARALVESMMPIADKRDAWFSQALLRKSKCRTADFLVRSGFQHVADVDVMLMPVDHLMPPQPPDGRVHFRTYSDSIASDREFAHVVASTWIDSLDCKPLLGARSGEEALRSHRYHTTGDPADGLWTLLCVDAQPAGVLLLSDVNQHGRDSDDAEGNPLGIEIVYMGLAAEFRGQGLSRALLNRALQTARDRDAQYVQLAVDVSNTPAVAVYQRYGFVFQQQIACLGRLHPRRVVR